MRKRNSDRKQQNFVLTIGWRDELNRLRHRGVVTLCHTSRVERSAPMAVSSSSADERFRSDEVPDHGVKRVRWSPHAQDTKEFDPNESSVQIPSQEHNRGLKRQPESTTGDLEDAGDQENRGDDDDDDMKALGAVNEEPVITIGVNGETLDECESVEESYVDDVNGGFLDLEMVREARVEELAGYLKMQVYCRVPVAEIGSHEVIKTRWVDTNKGDEWSPEIRCRLVAKEVKKRNNTEEEESVNFFASTPPLEAIKFLISETMTKRVSRNNRPLKLSFIDVKKADLCSDVLRELYVEPPPEANEPPDIVWRLQRAMYGARGAPAAWEREWTKTLNSVGFESGVSNPALLHCETLDASMVVHGDDFITLGDSEALSEVERAMSDHYTIKVRAILGAGCDDAKEVRILNRYVRWKSDGGKNWMEYEPDPRHAEPGRAKGVTTPSVKKRLEDVLTTSPQLDALQTSKYRSVVMRALDEGIGTRHAETDGTIDDQFEASRTAFEETSAPCAVVRRTKHPQQTLYDWTCMVTVTMRVVSKLASARQVWC